MSSISRVLTISGFTKKIFLFLLLFAFAVFIFDIKPVFAADAWYNTSWVYRKKITFDNSGQTETFTNFPVLISLTSSNFTFSQAKSDGSDIRFTLSDGTVLSYEIESWDANAQTASIWVKVPSVTGSSNSQYIYMYYGNSGAADAQDHTAVWDSNFKMVQHLSDTIFKPTATTITATPYGIKGDATYLYVGTNDGLKIYNKSDMSLVRTLSAGTSVTRPYVRGNYLAYSIGTTNYVYDLSLNQVIATVTTSNYVRGVHIDSNNRAYFGEIDTGLIKYVNIGDLTQGSFTIGTDDVRDIGSNGSQIIVANNDSKVYLLNRNTFATDQTFTDSTMHTEVAQMDDTYIWYASDNRTVWIKNRNSPYVTVAILHGPSDDVTSVDYDNGYWFVTSDNSKVYVYSATTYNLVTVIDTGGAVTSAEYLWLDKTNHVLYFVRGENYAGGSDSTKIYSFSYATSPVRYEQRTDSTSNDTVLVGSETADSTTGKIASGNSFNGSDGVLKQKLYFSSSSLLNYLVNNPPSYQSYFSTFSGQTFYYALGANFAPFAGNGTSNNYFLRYYKGTAVEGGYIGAVGAGETTSQKVTNGTFEGTFTSGLASSWIKESSSHTYTQETSNVHSGSNAQKVTAATNGGAMGVNQNITFGTGKLFRYSAWVYSSSGDDMNFYMGNKFYSFTPTANAWYHVSGYANADATATNKVRIYVPSGSVQTGEYVIIDDVTIDEITDIPANQGAKLYSTQNGSTNALALTDTLDRDVVSNASVFSSNLQITPSLTVEAWVKPTTDTGTQDILGNWFNNKGYQINRNNQFFLAKINNAVIDSGATNKPSGSWYYVVLTANGTSEKLYVDGDPYISESNGATLPALADRFVAGASSISAQLNPYSGSLDEIRVSNTDRSADWIKAQYLSTNGSFTTFSTAESILPSPTPTPSTTTSTTSSTVASTTEPKTCQDQMPSGKPDLFQIDATTNSAQLFFSPASGPLNKYQIAYGYSSNEERFAVEVQQGDSKGVLSYTVNGLSPNTIYYFKIKAGNGCTAGEWGNEMKMTTAKTTATSISNFKNFAAKIRSILPRKVVQLQQQQTVTPAAPSAVCEYVVKPGDSLWSIAKNHSQNGLNYAVIVSLNNLKSILIFPGQKLQVGC